MSVRENLDAKIPITVPSHAGTFLPVDNRKEGGGLLRSYEVTLDFRPLVLTGAGDRNVHGA